MDEDVRPAQDARDVEVLAVEIGRVAVGVADRGSLLDRERVGLELLAIGHEHAVMGPTAFALAAPGEVSSPVRANTSALANARTSESSSWFEISGAVIGRFAWVKRRVHAAPEVGSEASSAGEIQM